MMNIKVQYLLPCPWLSNLWTEFQCRWVTTSVLLLELRLKIRRSGHDLQKIVVSSLQFCRVFVVPTEMSPSLRSRFWFLYLNSPLFRPMVSPSGRLHVFAFCTLWNRIRSLVFFTYINVLPFSFSTPHPSPHRFLTRSSTVHFSILKIQKFLKLTFILYRSKIEISPVPSGTLSQDYNDSEIRNPSY